MFVLSQIVCQCCEEADPSSALEKLMSRVKEGLISEAALPKLLRTLQQKTSSSFPEPLLSLLEETERNTKQQPGGRHKHCDYVIKCIPSSY